MDIKSYLDEIRVLYASGQTTEHSFRPALVKLFKAIDPALVVINEPKHLTDVGAPDFVFNRNEIAIGWCEAKDIGKDVRKLSASDYSKSQKERYKKGLPNLIYTNSLDFEFIREGDVIDFISIAEIGSELIAITENFGVLETRLRDFAATTPQTITSSRHLAEMMAGKAAIIKDIMGRALIADLKAHNAGEIPSDLIGQYEAFKSNLIHDIKAADFADIYAETIAYGLFAARLHDTTPKTFTRAEALELLPKSNPFLRELFIYIAGPNLDDRLRRVIDELCNLFAATNMTRVLANFGKVTARQDPFLHFYEVFLAEYNPAKRKARGVWYTPEPVVNFIVRAVDEVLKAEFGLKDGLADTSRTIIDWDTGQNDKKGRPLTLRKEVHRVQVLDPATGTGTFLAEVVKLVAQRVKSVAPGQWSNYVERDLIPRLHGFEILMASYAMCHMKLDMILTNLGYKPSAKPPRLGVYLTNSLEEGERVEQTLFGLSRAIAEEGKAASDIKRQTPIMCIIGNPPYSGHSSNIGPWIKGLMNVYKVSPELKQPAQAKWLSDDYVKFVRFAEHMVEKNGEGILGFITNHGYLDNPTFLDMRHHLRQTFDRIYVIDLHGNAKKKEVSPDGSPDSNVFDIQQGVAIIIAVKRRSASKKKPLASVFHGDLWGDRETKYKQLWDGEIGKLASEDASSETTPWRFKPSDAMLETSYQAGFSLEEMFSLNGRLAPGIVTTHDQFAISWTAHEARQKVDMLLATSNEEDARNKFRLCKQNQWNYAAAKAAMSDGGWRDEVTEIAYRPFDTRFTVYNSHVAVHRRRRVMEHMYRKDNISLLVTKAVQDRDYAHCFIAEKINEVIILSPVTGSNAMSIPLYLYPADNSLDKTVRVNLDEKLYARLRRAAGLTKALVIPDGTDNFRKATGSIRPDEIKVFDYIYAVLHSPAYRSKYAALLKRGLPRIPFPPSPQIFSAVSTQGETLRRLHLMEEATIGDTPYAFEGDGNSMVDKPGFKDGRVWVNDIQYFENVPAVAWEFRIGGYQPAQKWLKERKGHTLDWDAIRHYQRIIKVLIETDRIMHEIELPI